MSDSSKSIMNEWIQIGGVPEPYVAAYCSMAIFTEIDVDTLCITRVYLTERQLQLRRKAGLREITESPLGAFTRQPV